MRDLTPFAALLAAAFSAGCFSHDYRSKPRLALVDGDPIVQMSPPGKLPSLLDPRFVPTFGHDDPPFGDEVVAGVELGPRPRLYPIGLLDTYEVVDAVDGNVPYVVARCPLTGLVAVFDRRAGGRALTFENSGALWRDMLVLRDRETGTYWNPATGRALEGPLAGETLRGIPAPVAAAEAWQASRRDSLCLRTGDTTAVPLSLRLYAASDWEGVSGVKTSARRFAPKQTVCFVALNGEALAFAPEAIGPGGSVAASVRGVDVTIEWDAALRVPRAYRQGGSGREEIPVVPIYWFALTRHFSAIRVLEPGPNAGRPRTAGRSTAVRDPR